MAALRIRLHEKRQARSFNLNVLLNVGKIKRPEIIVIGRMGDSELPDLCLRQPLLNFTDHKVNVAFVRHKFCHGHASYKVPRKACRITPPREYAGGAGSGDAYCCGHLTIRYLLYRAGFAFVTDSPGREPLSRWACAGKADQKHRQAVERSGPEMLPEPMESDRPR